MKTLQFGPIQTNENISSQLSEKAESGEYNIYKESAKEIGNLKLAPSFGDGSKDGNITSLSLLDDPENFKMYTEDVLSSISDSMDLTNELSNDALDKIDSVIKKRINSDLFSGLGGSLGFRNVLRRIKANPCQLGSMSLSNLLKGPQFDLQAYSLASILSMFSCSGVINGVSKLKDLISTDSPIDMQVYSKAIINNVFNDKSASSINFFKDLVTNNQDLAKSVYNTMTDSTSYMIDFMNNDRDLVSLTFENSEAMLSDIKTYDTSFLNPTNGIDLTSVVGKPNLSEVSSRVSESITKENQLLSDELIAPALTDEDLVLLSKDAVLI